MKIVIDTNVYLSHFRFGGLPTRVCLFCLEEADVFVSDFLVAEILRVLAEKFALPIDQLNFVSETLAQATQHVTPTNPLPTRCRDPDDNYVVNERLLKKLGVRYPASVIGRELRSSWNPKICRRR